MKMLLCMSQVYIRKAQGIVTRDFNGFKKSKINVYQPEELLVMLELKNASESC
jgi:hypothetical protein